MNISVINFHSQDFHKFKQIQKKNVEFYIIKKYNKKTSQILRAT